MTNIGKQCLFLFITMMVILGCSKTPPSPSLAEPSIYNGSLPPFSTPVTPEEVRLAFYKYSPRAIVEKLSENNEANWRMIMKKMAEGDAEWILYAYLYIRPGTDAGYSEEFKDGLAYALENNPEAVLSLEGLSERAFFWACGWPFVEPEYDFVLRYGKNALAALRKVDNPDLQESRDMCLRELESGFEFMKKIYWQGQYAY